MWQVRSDDKIKKLSSTSIMSNITLQFSIKVLFRVWKYELQSKLHYSIEYWWWYIQATGGERGRAAESLRHHRGGGGQGGGAVHHAGLHSLQQDIPRVLADSSQLKMEPGQVRLN